MIDAGPEHGRPAQGPGLADAGGRACAGRCAAAAAGALHSSFGRLPDWEQNQILSSLQRIVALMEAGDVEAGPILTTGPLDASPEETEAFLEVGGGAVRSVLSGPVPATERPLHD